MWYQVDVMSMSDVLLTSVTHTVKPLTAHFPAVSHISHDMYIAFLADRTATQYDRLLASSCCPSVRLSVCLSVTLCIVALRVGVEG